MTVKVKKMSNNINNSNHKRKNSKGGEVPFYEAPSDKPTSSQIIKEAREKLNDSQQSIHKSSHRTQISPTSSSSTISTTQQAVSSPQTINNSGSGGINSNLVSIQTNRPFTPREGKRSLFGTKSVRPVNERPPSAFR